MARAEYRVLGLMQVTMSRQSRADSSVLAKTRVGFKHKLLREELRYIVAQRAYMPEDLRLNS